MPSLILVLFAIFTGTMAFVYSMRWRRADKEAHIQLNRAKMNVSQGLMITALSIDLLIYNFSEPLRIGIGILFLTLGVINLFFGIKKYLIYRTQS